MVKRAVIDGASRYLSILPWSSLLSLPASGAEERASRIVAQDSSGIRIVSNPAPTDRLPRLSIADDPSLVIGTQAGDSSFVLYRVHDARLLSDGRIVIQNGQELLWFHADGEFQERNGGMGEGPAEFRGLIRLEVLPGDTVLAINRSPPSAKVFTPTGTYTSSVPIRPLPVAVGRFPNGRWVGLAFLGEDAPREPGIFRERWGAVVLDSIFNTIDTLAFPEGRMFYGDRRQSVHVPHSPRAILATRGDRAVVGSSDRYELRVFESTGRHLMLIRNIAPNPAVGPATNDNDDSRRELPREAGGPARRHDPPLPQSAPAFDEVVVANDGAVWVRRYDPIAADREWHVYDAQGRLAAQARISARLQPTEITESHVLGIWRDELDVESVRMFRITRDPEP
jgi:hypothetical protein